MKGENNIMKIETYIRNYAKKNPKPDQNYCPNLEITWRFSAGRKHYNPKTGTITTHGTYERVGHYGGTYTLNARSSCTYGAYAKQIKNGEIIEFAFLVLRNMKRGQEGEIREWEYFVPNDFTFPRVFLVKETAEIYTADGRIFYPDCYGRYYNHAFVNMLKELCHSKYIVTNNIYNEMDQFAGGVRAGCNHIYFWGFQEYYKNMRPRNIKENAVLSYKLNEVTDKPWVVLFEILDDKYAVFRVKRYGSEYYRVFISNKGKVTVTSRKGSIWAVTSIPYLYAWYSSYSDDNKKTITADNLKAFEGLKYVADIVIGDTDIDTVDNIITMLRHPIIEKLVKAGYPKMAKAISRRGEIKATTMSMFGIELKNEKGSITKMLGVNKYMLNEYERNIESNGYYYGSCPIKTMKEFFGDKLMSLSEDDIRMYYKVFGAIGYRGTNFAYYFLPENNNEYFWRNGTQSEINDENREYLMKLIKKLAKTGKEGTEMYMDAMSTWKRLINRPDIDWLDFKTAEDIARLHDNLIGLLNLEAEMKKAERDKALTEAFEKLQSKRIKKYEDTESNDNFIIRVPKGLNEITTEGQTLGHCVGGYVDRHAKGNTNILFLRKKDTPNTPFYTIEVDNSGYIVQIHGRHNRWLGNDPEAISFVHKWITERGLSCEDYKLLNKGAGYSRGNEQVGREWLTA